MIVQEVTMDDFVRAFKDYNRENNFSYESLEALYNHLDSDDDEEPFMFYVIATCCNFIEYTFKEFIDSYGDSDTIMGMVCDKDSIHEIKAYSKKELAKAIAEYKDLSVLVTDNYIIVER